jgi:hypothetical protein
MKEIEPMPMADSQAGAPMGSTQAPQEETSDDMGAMIEARLNELPDNQKAFLSQYLAAPETSAILGLILGNEALDHFIKFADPSVMLQVVPRPQAEQAPPQGGQPGPQGPQQGLMAPPQSAPTGAPAMGPM